MFAPFILTQPRPRAIVFCIFAVLGLFVTPSEAAEKPRQHRASTAIDQAIADQMDQQGIVGLAAAVIEGNRIAYAKGYGMADLKQNKPVSTKTIFNWASISKALLAARVMQLVEQRKLTLTASVRTYMPALPAHYQPVTVAALLCHQSGIPHYQNGTIIGDGRSSSDEELLDPNNANGRFINSPLTHQPGEAMVYSSYAYVLLTAVVQAAGKKPIQKQLDRYFIEPLKLSSFELDTRTSGRADTWAIGYIREGRRFVPVAPHHNF